MIGKESIDSSVIIFGFRHRTGKRTGFKTGSDFTPCGSLIDYHKGVGTGMIRIPAGSGISACRSRFGDFRRISPCCDHCLNVGHVLVGGSIVIRSGHRIDDECVQNQFFVTADRGEIAVIECNMYGTATGSLYGIIYFYRITDTQFPCNAFATGYTDRTNQASDYSCSHDFTSFPLIIDMSNRPDMRHLTPYELALKQE